MGQMTSWYRPKSADLSGIYIPDKDEDASEAHRRTIERQREHTLVAIIGIKNQRNIEQLSSIFYLEQCQSAEELYEFVQARLEQNEHVPAELARRYVHHVFYGGFEDIDPALHRGGLEGMPLADKLVLYESIANEYDPRNIQYLSALNAELGLGADFFKREAEETASFFSERNLNFLTRTKPDMMHNLRQYLDNPQSLPDQQKEKLFQDIINSYCDFCEMPRANVICKADKNENLLGYYQSGSHNITLNTNSFCYQDDPWTMIETLIHEARHGKQHCLAQRYQRGEISPDAPSYVAARVFYANLRTTGGYICSGDGFDNYFEQPSEIDARMSGTMAVCSIARYFNKPSAAVFAPAA